MMLKAFYMVAGAGILLLLSGCSNVADEKECVQVNVRENDGSVCKVIEQQYSSLKSNYSQLEVKFDGLLIEKNRILEEGLSQHDQLKSVKQLINLLSSTLLLVKNPSGTLDYNDFSYAACGEKFKGSKSGCSFTVHCSTSMSPLFRCEEKLLFTTKKLNNIEVGDIIDIQLTNPVITSVDGKDFEYSRVIHVVRQVNGDKIVSGRLNPGSQLYAKGEFADDFEVRKSDVKGVLKGVVW